MKTCARPVGLVVTMGCLLLAACAGSPGRTSPTPAPARATPAAAASQGMRLAMVVLARPEEPSAAAFVEDYERRWGQHVEHLDAGPGAFVCDVARGHAMVGFMPVAIPWGDLEYPARFAWLWQDAEKVLRAHQAHLIVALTPSAKPDAVADALELTRVVASLTAVTPAAVAVYWGEGPAVMPRDLVLELSAKASAEHLPVLLWLGFFPIESADGRRGLTSRGMLRFGQRELMLVSPRPALAELLPTIADVAHYLLVNGPVIKDGDTFGPSEADHWPTHYVAAPWDADEQVIQLEMP